MGWLFTQGQTRRQLIDHLTRTEENEHTKWVTLRRYCSGNTLYAVQERTVKATGEVTRFIGVYLMQREQNYGWGYKDMDESCGPCEITCPLGFFDAVPDPGGYATAWRQRCREAHARKFQKLAVGQTVRLTNGEDYKITKFVRRKVYGIDKNGCEWRIPRKMLTLHTTQEAAGA